MTEGPFPPFPPPPGFEVLEEEEEEEGSEGVVAKGSCSRSTPKGLQIFYYFLKIFLVVGKQMFTTHLLAPEVDGGMVFDLNFDLSLTSLGLFEAAPAPAPCGLAE